jgi:hypothetical protein
MFEIIILFVVISLISNIIKAVGKSKSIYPREVGREPSADLQELGLPDNRVEATPEVHKIKIKTPAPEIGLYPEVKVQKPPKEEKDRVVFQASSQPKVGLASLTPDRLVEGVILSEILGPPKSRRKNL